MTTNVNTCVILLMIHYVVFIYIYIYIWIYFISFSKELNHFIQHYNNTKTTAAVGWIVILEKIKWLSTTYWTKSAILGNTREEFTFSCVYQRYRVLCISCPGSLSWPKLITGIYRRCVTCLLYIYHFISIWLYDYILYIFVLYYIIYDY